MVLSEGDSISIFWGGSHTGLYAAERPGLKFYGNANGGSRIQNNGGNSLVERLNADLALRPTHVTVLIGANDMTTSVDANDSASTPTAWLTALWSYTDRLRATGAKVAVGTLLPQCNSGNPVYDASFARRRVLANAAIRAAVGTRIDAVIDFAANPIMGDDADACNAVYYSDGLHPTFAGQQQMLVTYRTAVDALIAPK